MEFWKAEARRLLRRVSPADFEHTPIYILSRRELDERFDTQVVCGAWTSDDLDLRLQDYLSDAGLWQGRGFAFVTFEHHFRDCHNFDEQMMLLSLHEAAHRFQRGTRASVIEAPHRAMEAAYQKFYGVNPVETLDKKEPQKQEPWASHGADFIRIGIHMAYRAGVPASWLWDQGRYRLAPIEQYSQLLGDEPRQRQDDSLFAIADSEPPEAFSAFSRADLDRAQRVLLGTETGRG